MLEVTGLHVAYGGIQAVRSITFHVNQGEMVALIGANGAGKTSTLKAISRVIDAVGGDYSPGHRASAGRAGRLPAPDRRRKSGDGRFPAQRQAGNCG